MKNETKTNLEKSFTDVNINARENEMELNTLEEVQFNELIDRFEVKKGNSKEYVIPAYKEEPPCEVIERIVKSNFNDVNIVNAGFQYTEKVCKHFHQNHQGSISFTFHLGSCHSGVLKYWNPKGPSIWEILSTIKLANAYRYRVNVICLPLDQDTFGLVQTLTPFVNEIHINLPYDIEDYLSEDDRKDYDKIIKANEIMQNQTDEWVLSLVEKLNNNPIVTWGEFINRIRITNMISG